VLATGDDLYVLPSAVTLVEDQPPAVDRVDTEFADGRLVASIQGSNLRPDTRILFDGVPGTVIGFDEAAQLMRVAPPAASPDYRATVVALNDDGQTSLFLQDPPPLFVYPAGDPPAVTLSASALPAGVEAMIEVAGIQTGFAQRQTAIGFGSSDIAVKRLWVVSPNLLRASVAVAADGAPAPTQLTVVSGLQVIVQPLAFQVLPADAGAIVLSPDLLDADTGLDTVYPGSTAVLLVSNLPAPAPADLSLLLNDTRISILSAEQGQVRFRVPRNMKAGPAVLGMEGAGKPVYPVIVLLEQRPIAITAVMAAGGIIDQNNPARPGDLVSVMVSDLGEFGSMIPAGLIRVTVAGIEQRLLSDAVPAPDGVNAHLVHFFLSSRVPPQEAAPVIVAIDERVSAPYGIPVAAQLTAAWWAPE
jgi:hypothetical protein